MSHEDVRSLRRLYRRASRYYDAVDWPMEHFRYRRIRRELWARAEGRVLDLGAGTGRNAAYYGTGATVTAADLSPEMLARARQRLAPAGHAPRAVVSDALRLSFRDGAFDACVSTFLFCVLPDALQEAALKEVARVLRPGGTVHLLEYVYSRRTWRRRSMQLMAPLVESLFGARFDRDTRRHLRAAGFRIVEETLVHSDIVLKLTAERPPEGSLSSTSL